MDSEEEVDACAALVVGVLMEEETEKPKKRERRNWVNQWLLKRETQGSYGGLFTELCSENEIFKKYLRIPLPTFEFLLEKVRPIIEKEDTHLRAAIPAGARLEATLLYLITGLPYARLQFHTRISASSLCSIIPETCDALYFALKDEYLKVGEIIYYLTYIFYVRKKKATSFIQNVFRMT